eukprot:2494986-Prymnesium_polylepis.1
MFTARVASERRGTAKCATARKSWCAAFKTFRCAQTEPGAADVLQEHVALISLLVRVPTVDS